MFINDPVQYVDSEFFYNPVKQDQASQNDFLHHSSFEGLVHYTQPYTPTPPQTDVPGFGGILMLAGFVTLLILRRTSRRFDD